MQIGCENSLLYGAPKRLVAAIGLNNLVVVDTEDAVLIASKDRTQEIKKIFEEIKNNNLPQCRQHLTVYRPWGYYTVFEEGEGFKVKKIRVLPRKKLSLQAHQKRSEHWIVLSGTAKVQLNGGVLSLRARIISRVNLNF